MVIRIGNYCFLCEEFVKCEFVDSKLCIDELLFLY